jgi:hypothetical protein
MIRVNSHNSKHYFVKKFLQLFLLFLLIRIFFMCILIHDKEIPFTTTMGLKRESVPNFISDKVLLNMN